MFLPVWMGGKPTVFVKAFIDKAKGCSNGFVVLTKQVNFGYTSFAIIGLQQVDEEPFGNGS